MKMKKSKEISFIKLNNGKQEYYLFIKTTEEKDVEKIFVKTLKIIDKIKCGTIIG